MQRLPQSMWLGPCQTWSNSLWYTSTDTSGGVSFLYQFQVHLTQDAREEKV